MAKQHQQHIQIRGNRTRNHNPDGKTTSTTHTNTREPYKKSQSGWQNNIYNTYKYEGTVQEITIRMAKQHQQHIQIRLNRTSNHNPHRHKQHK